MKASADVLVVGATGFTGNLVCDALRRGGVSFAIGGRSEARLVALSERLGGVETRVIDLAEPETIRDAIAGRKMVSACAGPFAKVGEPILATSARAGVHYADTTGEQGFVARAVQRYRATAEARGACVVPALAYEIALSDWASHLAAARLGGKVDSLAILYALRMPEGQGSSRGTQRSMLAQIGDEEAMQFVAGRLCREPAGEVVRRFTLSTGKEVTAASFPSPEAVMVPMHTGAREVRTFMAVGAAVARTLHVTRKAAPFAVRALTSLAERRIDRAAPGPDEQLRAATRFEIVVVARRDAEEATVRVTGTDPYGLTAAIQALAARRAVRGELVARGVIAPSVALEPQGAFDALAPLGVSVA